MNSIVNVLHSPLSEGQLRSGSTRINSYKYVSLDITTFPFETNLGVIDVPICILPPDLTVFHPLS
jgi:hypothetical protein